MKKSHNKNDIDITMLAQDYKWPEPAADLHARIMHAVQTRTQPQENFWDRLFDVFSLKWEPALAMGAVLILGLSFGHIKASQNTYSKTERIGLYDSQSHYGALFTANSKGDI